MNEFSSAADAPPPEPDPAAKVAAEVVAELRAAAERALGNSKAQWKEVGDQAMAYAKEHPGKAVLAGLGVGFVIGLLYREK